MTDQPASQEDFEAAFEAARPRLRAAVLAACPPDAEWPARVAAAIYAVLDFAIADPAAICVLTRDALLHRPDGPQRFLELTAEFAELLRRVASPAGPHQAPLPEATEQALVGGVAMIITDHLRAERLDRLREAGPELVELSLQPYLGRVQARRWSQRSPA
jgi:hypothetical protein